MKTLRFLLLFAVLLSVKISFAQCDSIAERCANHMNDGFVSDGQAYRALLLGEEVAEFHATFYGGSAYRIAACSGKEDGNLLFRVFDEERNEIFNSEDHGNPAFWDFDVTNTLNVIIEAQLDPHSGSSGCAVLLIGFSQ